MGINTSVASQRQANAFGRALSSARAMAFIITGTLALALSVTSSTGAAESDLDAVFAKVGDTVITVGEYGAALREGVRKRFFHGTPPQSQLDGGEEMVQIALHTLTITVHPLAADISRERLDDPGRPAGRAWGAGPGPR